MPTIAITVIGHNEGHLLSRALESVRWADQIVYVDCESNDDAIEVARRYTDRVFSQPNRENLNVNKSYAIEQATTDWVFYLDPDEVVPPKLAEEIQSVIATSNSMVAYKMPRRNYYFGRWLRHGGAYPDRQLRLFRRGKAHFPCKDVHEHLLVDGKVGRLREAMDHYPSNTVLDSLRKIDFYSSFYGRELARSGKKPTIAMAIQYMVIMPAGRFVRRYFFKQGFLDGWPGFLQAVIWGMDFQLRFFKFWHHYKQGASSPEKPTP